MRFLTLAFVLTSASAFACPDLSGTYAACRSTTGSSAGSSEIVVSQSIDADGITTYVMTSTGDEAHERKTESVVVNGIPVSETDESQGFPITFTSVATCTGDESLDLNGNIKVQGQDMVTVLIQVTKANGVMTQTFTGSIMGQDVSDVQNCQ